MNDVKSLSHSKWKGVAFNVVNTNGRTGAITGAISIMIDNRAQWNQQLYGLTLNTQFMTQPLELESHVNVLSGAIERSQAGAVMYISNRQHLE